MNLPGLFDFGLPFQAQMFLTGLESALRSLAQFVSSYSPYINFTAAVVALVCSLFLLFPSDGHRLVGRWVKYIGIAFFTFFILFGLRYLFWLYVSDSKNEALIESILQVIIYLLSSLNNLLFLAAARILLNKEGPFRSMPPGPDAGRLEVAGATFRGTVRELRAALPKWALVAAAVSVITSFGNEESPWLLWLRVPDALFSAYCLTLFGYAVMINFNFRRRIYLATMALLVALVYGLMQFVFAANPLLAYASRPDSFQTFDTRPARWLKREVGAPIRTLVIPPPESRDGATTQKKVTRFLDSVVFAAALPLKFLLFLPAFILYFLFVISANDFRRVLHETAMERKDYLSAAGIVGAIGKGLSADLVELFMRLPGRVKEPASGELREQVQPIRWESGGINTTDAQELPVPLTREADPLLFQIMKGDGEEIIRSPAAPTERALIMIPVKFHGGVIGCLKVELQGFGKYNYTVVQQARMMAALVAPPVQGHRALAAMDELGYRFARLQVKHRAIRFPKAIRLVLKELYDVTAPLGAAIFLESGFTSEKHVHAEREDVRATLDELPATFKVQAPPPALTLPGVGKVQRHVDMLNITKRLDDDTLSITKRFGDPLGNIVFAIPKERDKFDAPTLATYYLNRKTIASLTTDTLFDIARDHFSVALKRLGLRLGRQKLTRETWLKSINLTARWVGLNWAVAADPDGGRMLGDEAGQAVVRGLSDEERRTLEETALACVVINPAKPPTYHVIRLDLGDSRQQLWFGVRRPGFGHELSFNSPWKVFLESVAEIAASSLKFIHEREATKKAQDDAYQSQAKTAELEFEAAQTQGMMTIAVTTGILMHHLVNMMKSQVFAVFGLQEAARHGEITLDERSQNLLKEMGASAENMLQLTTAFKNVTKMDEDRPCSLRAAAEEATKLFHSSLVRKNIEVEVNIDAGLRVDVPFHVPAFAIANLINNARDAIHARGKITIEAEEKDGDVLCYVTDNGPGIRPENRDRLFELGFSKTDGHNGWGLYLVARAMRMNGGSIQLTHSRPEYDFTSFTLRLPSPPPA